MAKIKAGKREVKANAAKAIDSFDGKTIELNNGTIVHAFKLGRDCGVISVVDYKGKKSLDIRRFYLGDDDAWYPTSKGVRIPSEQVGSFLDALHDEHNAIFALLN